ncbi:MAG: hypothetical protein JWN98_1549, partial [Abditibacteriota bacterium]|nr:hypothetical protein [Abditibacteriota bacterium]
MSALVIQNLLLAIHSPLTAMLQRLTHNWNLKLMSLVLAIALWSHVRGEVNPWETTSFRVPLQLDLPSQMVLLNRDKIPATVKVTLRAPRSRLRELKGFTPPNPLAPTADVPLLSREEVTARLDFSLARLGKQNVPIRVEVRGDDIEVIGKPDDVVAVLDRAASARLPVQPDLSVPRGYEVREVVPAVHDAVVFGPANVLERVASVQAPLRSGSLSLNTSKTVLVPLVAVDAQGEAIEELRIEPAKINISATLREQIVSRRVRVTPKLRGAAGSGVDISSVRVTPRFLLVRGPHRVIDRLQS